MMLFRFRIAFWQRVAVEASLTTVVTYRKKVSLHRG